MVRAEFRFPAESAQYDRRVRCRGLDPVSDKIPLETRPALPPAEFREFERWLASQPESAIRRHRAIEIAEPMILPGQRLDGLGQGRATSGAMLIIVRRFGIACHLLSTFPVGVIT